MYPNFKEKKKRRRERGGKGREEKEDKRRGRGMAPENFQRTLSPRRERSSMADARRMLASTHFFLPYFGYEIQVH